MIRAIRPLSLVAPAVLLSACLSNPPIDSDKLAHFGERLD